jgi:excisionase family DNA binding protein
MQSARCGTAKHTREMFRQGSVETPVRGGCQRSHRQREAPVNNQALSISRVARRLDVSERTARRLVEVGELKAYRIGRQWRVLSADLQVYLAGNANRAASAVEQEEPHESLEPGLRTIVASALDELAERISEHLNGICEWHLRPLPIECDTAIAAPKKFFEIPIEELGQLSHQTKPDPPMKKVLARSEIAQGPIGDETDPRIPHVRIAPAKKAPKLGGEESDEEAVVDMRMCEWCDGVGRGEVE